MSKPNYLYQPPLDFSKQVGVVLGSFAPLHKGHLHEIYTAKKECLGGVIVVVCGKEGDKGYPRMPLPLRYRLVYEFFKDDPLVAVYYLSDNDMGIAEYNDKWDIWLSHFIKDVVMTNQVQHMINLDNLVFYVGEHDYAEHIIEEGFATRLMDRTIVNISATQIRENPHKYWNDMAWTFHRVFSYNILVIGTASEGKTTLVEDIGRYFNTAYSCEWPRKYIDKHCIGDWDFNANDFLCFLTGQYEHNRACLESHNNRGVFIADTDTTVTEMYAYMYAVDKNMSLTYHEFEDVILPVSRYYIPLMHWDRIFLIHPHENFVDDHSRYLGHADIAAREQMYDYLCRILKQFNLWDKVITLTNDYLNNFQMVRAEVEGILKNDIKSKKHSVQ